MTVGMFLECEAEVLVEILDSHPAQPMKDSPHFDTIAGVRIGTVPDYGNPGRKAHCSVNRPKQNRALAGSSRSKAGALSLSTALANVRFAACNRRNENEEPPYHLASIGDPGLLNPAHDLPASQPVRAAGPWYVAPGGDDSSTCAAPGAACASINGALSKPGFVAGDTVLVATGAYTGAGDQVVLLDRNATLSGGWDANFTEQSGLSTIDGQGTRLGVTVNFGITALVEHFIIQNGHGGGIYNNCGSPGHLTLNDSTISGNTTEGAGGGIYNYGTATLNNTTVSGNKAASCGGIYNYYVDVILNNSIVSGNTVHEHAGGICNSGYSDTIMTLNNSTVSGNTANDGGGIYNSAVVILNNSTVSGNTARFSGGGITSTANPGLGSCGSTTLNNSTVSANTASAGGGIFLEACGTLTMQNSVLAGNGGSGPDCKGAIVSAGYNLIGDTAGCSLHATTGDLTNVDAHLGVLIGFPGYHPLLSGSPAIDAGDPASCGDTDQRGASRVGRCDIGAYEYAVSGPAARINALAGTPQTTPPFSTFKTLLQVAVLDSIGSPVSGTTVSFLAPASGASGTFANSGTFTTTAMTDETGVATAAAFTANGLNGSYTVTATVSGVVAPVNFLLANRAWYVAPGGNDANNCQAPASPAPRSTAY